jgi:hypothetical protein
MLSKMTGGQQFFDYNRHVAERTPMGFARFITKDQVS